MGENSVLHDVLTLEEAAKFLRLSTKEVRELGRQGRIPFQKIGRNYRFLKVALIDWLRNANTAKKAWAQFGAFADDSTMPELRKIIEENRRRLDAEIN